MRRKNKKPPPNPPIRDLTKQEIEELRDKIVAIDYEASYSFCAQEIWDLIEEEDGLEVGTLIFAKPYKGYYTSIGE